MPLKPVLGGVRIVAFSIKSHKQTQKSRACCFLILQVLSITEGSVFLNYLLQSVLWKIALVCKGLKLLVNFSFRESSFESYSLC